MINQQPSRGDPAKPRKPSVYPSLTIPHKPLTCGNDEADPARRRIGFIVLLSQTTCARQDSNL